MKLNIFSDLRNPGLVPGESLSLSENYDFCFRETLIHKFKFKFKFSDKNWQSTRCFKKKCPVRPVSNDKNYQSAKHIC